MIVSVDITSAIVGAIVMLVIIAAYYYGRESMKQKKGESK